LPATVEPAGLRYPISYLFAAWIINEVIVASMEGLSSIHRVQHNFVTNHNLQKNNNVFRERIL
jgi:hypothetical protein